MLLPKSFMHSVENKIKIQPANILLVIIMTISLAACNTYAINEYKSLGYQSYTCECKTADGDLVEAKQYANKSRKAAVRYCSDTENTYRKNNQNISCSLK